MKETLDNILRSLDIIEEQEKGEVSKLHKAWVFSKFEELEKEITKLRKDKERIFEMYCDI